MTTIDLDQMSLEALKALAYDFIAQMEKAQESLKAINAMIGKRTTSPVTAKKDESPRASGKN